MSGIEDIAALLSAAAPVAKVVYDIASGQTTSKADAARALVDAALDGLATAEELHDFLTEAARARGEAAFLAAKLAKKIESESGR